MLSRKTILANRKAFSLKKQQFERLQNKTPAKDSLSDQVDFIFDHSFNNVSPLCCVIYEDPIRLQVINSQAVGNGPRVLLVFAKVNMLKNDDQDIRSFRRQQRWFPGVVFGWSEGTGRDKPEQPRP